MYVIGNGQQGLTDAHLVTLSNMVTEHQTLRNLAVVGLEMNRVTVDSRLNENRINDAAYEVLSEWRKTQANGTEAYSNMCKALKHKHVKLESFIEEVLQ